MTETNLEHPSVLHITWAIEAIRRELEDVPPFSVTAETRKAEIVQLIDMLDRRRDRTSR